MRLLACRLFLLWGREKRNCSKLVTPWSFSHMLPYLDTFNFYYQWRIFLKYLPGKRNLSISIQGAPCLLPAISGFLSSCLFKWTCAGIKFEAAKLRGDIIHYSWLLDCHSQKKLLTLQPKLVFPPLALVWLIHWIFRNFTHKDIRYHLPLEGTFSSFLTLQGKSCNKKSMKTLTLTTWISTLKTSNR